MVIKEVYVMNMNKMIMKRNVFFIIAILTLLSCASCIKEDDENLLVGTWKRSTNIYMKLGEDGSYYSYIDPDPYSADGQYRKGSYSYDETTKTMVIDIYAIPNHNNASTRTYYVQTLTSSTLVLLDLSNGEAYSYSKQ